MSDLTEHAPAAAHMRNVELRKDTSLSWRAPASGEAVYATGTTPLGRVALTRRPGVRTSPEAAAEAREDWAIFLRDELRLALHGFAVPGHVSQKALKKGLAGSLDGEGFRLEVSSAFSQSKRSVRLSGKALDVAFRPSGLTIQLLVGGVTQGVRRMSGWDLSHPTDAGVLSACLFEWAEMEFFLRTPGLRLL